MAQIIQSNIFSIRLIKELVQVTLLGRYQQPITNIYSIGNSLRLEGLFYAGIKRYTPSTGNDDLIYRLRGPVLFQGIQSSTLNNKAYYIALDINYHASEIFALILLYNNNQRIRIPNAQLSNKAFKITQGFSFL